MSTGEEYELLRFGFRKYWLISLYCSRDGLLRLALPYTPENTIPCPICGRSCACGVLPCVGFTRRELPAFDQLVPAISLAAFGEDDEARRPAPPPKPLKRAWRLDPNR